MAEIVENKTPREYITSAFVRLGSSDSALYLAALNMEPVATNDPSKTLAIRIANGKAELLYNPYFVSAIGKSPNGIGSLRVLLGMEAARILLMHATTRIKSNKPLSLLASNLTIKDAMRELKGYCDKKIYATIPSYETLRIPEQKTFEAYYEVLLAESMKNQQIMQIMQQAMQLQQQQQQGSEGNMGGTGQGKGEKEQEDQDGNGQKNQSQGKKSQGNGKGQDKSQEQEQQKKGSGQGEKEKQEQEKKEQEQKGQVQNEKEAFERHFEPGKNTNAENWQNDEELTEEIKQFIKDHIDEIKSCGSLAGDLALAIIEASGKNEIKPGTILRRFLANIETVDIEESRCKPNRRRGWEAPGYCKTMTYHVLVGMDASGSVSDKEHEKCFVETNALTKACELDYVSWDTQVYEKSLEKGKKFKRVNKFKISNSKGGTTPECLFHFAKKRKYRNIVVLTDGEFGEFEIPGRFNICWITTHEVSDFMRRTGKVVELKKWKQ
jgi:predicted metal-dependent peptidase